jgi:hypothetical protein
VFDRLLGVIKEALQARVIRAGEDGEPMDLGPDHYARLTCGPVHQAVDSGAARVEGGRAHESGRDAGGSWRRGLKRECGRSGGLAGAQG